MKITGILFIVICLGWIVSEVLLARIKLSGTDSASELDRNSLRYLWITISLSVGAGVFLAVAGTGSATSIPYPIPLIGLPLIVAGLAIRWTAILTLKKYFTVDVAISEHHQLVTTGIYGWVRHPAYTGSLLSFLGLGLALGNWISLAVIIIPIWFAFLYRIRVEEQALQQAFGGTYREYMQKVRRLIPWIY